MTPALRWLIVALVAIAVTTPAAVLGLRPVHASRLSATELYHQIQRSRSLPWSGEVHTLGTLKVPKTDSFGGVARLLGEESTLRVWWRDVRHWRVDRTRASGEADLIREDQSTIRWTFEKQSATVAPYSEIRLPDESDMLPPTLTERLLVGSRASELSRLPGRRIAGHASAGLRLVPADTRSTISRVDVWADQKTGLPTQVEVYDGHRLAVLTSTMTSLDLGRPAASSTRFEFPPGIKVSHSYALDDAAGANAFAPFAVPDELAGLARRGDPADLGAVGVYGRGPTAILAIPLRSRISDQLRAQLRRSSSSTDSEAGTALSVGPLSILLTYRQRGTYLVTGTVTPVTLAEASAGLRDGVVLRQ